MHGLACINPLLLRARIYKLDFHVCKPKIHSWRTKFWHQGLNLILNVFCIWDLKSCQLKLRIIFTRGFSTMIRLATTCLVTDRSTPFWPIRFENLTVSWYETILLSVLNGRRESHMKFCYLHWSQAWGRCSETGTRWARSAWARKGHLGAFCQQGEGWRLRFYAGSMTGNLAVLWQPSQHGQCTIVWTAIRFPADSSFEK